MFSGKTHSGNNRNTRRLGVERLESRKTMTVGAEIVSGRLEIEGTESGDLISIDTGLYLTSSPGSFSTYQFATQVTIRDRVTNAILLQQRFNPSAIQDIFVASLGGNDKVTNNTSLPSTMDGGAGHDELFGGGAVDHLFGGSGNDDLYGGGGDDGLSGNGGNDDLWGGAGHDTLWGDTGYDELWGEAGNDTLYGGADDDDLFGGAGSDSMFGDDGNFHLVGDGDDYMVGGDGQDSMEGTGGNDIMYGQNGDDTLHGGNGDDDLYGGADDDTMHGGGGCDLFEGGGGLNHVYFTLSDESINGLWVGFFWFDTPTVVEGPYAGSRYRVS